MKMNKKTKKKKSPNNFKNTVYAIQLLWRMSKWYVIGGFFVQIMNYGVWVFDTLIFAKYVFGSSEMLRSFNEVMLFIGIMLGLYAFSELFSTCYYEWVYVKKMPEFNEKLNRMVFEKAVNVDISCFEDSDFYNDYTKAMRGASNHIIGTFNNATRLVGAFLSSLYVIYTMFSLNVWIGLLSMLPVVASFVIGKVMNKINYSMNMELVPDERRIDYVNRAFFLQKYSKEIRLSGAPRLLKKSLEESSRGYVRTKLKYGPKYMFWGFLNFALCFPIMFEGTWFLGAWLVMVKNALTISEYVVVASAAVSTTWMVKGLTDAIVSIMDNALYIDNLKTFLQYKERIPEDADGLPTPERVETLELRGVSFRYKESLPLALENINLTLRSGEMITLVGYNGSGKSTLVKLIMRLYDPTEGEILLNGIDIRKYNLKAYRRLIGATFQDYQMFSMSVTDNVCMGNDVGSDRKSAAENALKRSGVYSRIMELEHGMDNILTREFDDNGAQLSGGEAQKVAIARAFAKKSSILILDEPSSALDPIAENHVFSGFVELSKENENGEKICIFISHRLSSATTADRVVLLSGGVIAESGTHAELMEADGAYADMFQKQAENYIEVADCGEVMA